MSFTTHVTVLHVNNNRIYHAMKLLSKVCLFIVKIELAVCALCAETVRTEGYSLRPKNAGFISEITC